MNRAKTNTIQMVVLLVLLVVGTPLLAAAQTDPPRSSTGRHKPKPEPKKADSEEMSAMGLSAKRWFVGLGAGTITGGDLWHLETTSGHTALTPWESIVPFSTSRFNGSLGSNFNFNLFVGRRMSDMLFIRFDVNTSRMDVGAEALQGQQAAVFLYDRLTATMLGLSLETKLVHLASYPFLNVGLVSSHMTFNRETELDQNQLGFRIGLGYLKQLSPEFSLRAEVRYSYTGFDVGSFVPQVTGTEQPEVIFEPVDELHFFEMTLGVQMNI